MSLQYSDWRLVDDGAMLAQLEAQPVLKQMIMMRRKMMKSYRKNYRWLEMVTRPSFQ